TVAGLYRARWVSTGPAAAFDDVIDVRPSGGGVISLAHAKQHLNKSHTQQIDDEELRPIIAAAAERVDRHLWTRAQRDAGSTLTTATQVSASQRLAVLTVLDTYWATQRSRTNRPPTAGASPTVELDAGPAGAASLTARLTELLGPPAEGAGSVAVAPTGSYPSVLPWPDPIECPAQVVS
ncbi:MAG: phage gp6-like head-tail connector protein, partial [Actinomycetia bacterium]|nr:phage gp6-like head-tail connector protein [Actinomycetes bacterium]